MTIRPTTPATSPNLDRLCAQGVTFRVESGELVIARILHGGMIDQQGLLHVGDIIKEVNGKEVGNDPKVLQEMLKEASGSVVLKILPSYQEPHTPRQVSHIQVQPQLNQRKNEVMYATSSSSYSLASLASSLLFGNLRTLAKNHKSKFTVGPAALPFGVIFCLYVTINNWILLKYNRIEAAARCIPGRTVQ